MKYDRSMTEYNEIVGASIYYIARLSLEKLRAADIGTDTVSVMLKNDIGKSYAGHVIPNGIDVKSSARGMETDISRFFPNIEDKWLLLTWRDVARLIKDDDFYSKYIHAYDYAKKQPVTAQFDYNELAADESDRLRKIEQNIKTETASYFTILGANFKAAQELLANHSGGTFERWYTAMGFKRQTVYNLIQRHDFLCSPTVGEQKADIFEGLPLKLSYEISKPSAPPELVAKVLDGDITSHAEYQRLLAEMKAREAEIAALNKQVKELTTQNMLSDTNLRNVERNYSDLEKRHIKLGKDNTALSLRVKDLEARPVEIAVEKQEVIPEGYVSPEEHQGALDEAEKRNKKLSDEIVRLKASQNAEKTGKLAEQIAALEKQLREQQNETTKAYGKASKAAYDSETKAKALEEVQRKNAELERQIEELKATEQTEPDVSDKLFKIHKHNVITALTGFVAFAIAPENKDYRAKSIELLEGYIKTIRGNSDHA